MPIYTLDDWRDERHKYQFGHPDDPRPRERNRYAKSADRYPHTGDKELDAVLTKYYQLRVSVNRFLQDKTDFKINPPDGGKPTLDAYTASRRAVIMTVFADDLKTDIETIAPSVIANAKKAENKGAPAEPPKDRKGVPAE